MSAGQPVGRQKRAVTIAGELRRRIMRGEIEVGASLTEAALMAEFGIARPTLREALRILELEQLLSVQQGSHRGSVVRVPDSSIAVRNLTTLLHLRGATTRDIYDARLAFEPPAVRLAADAATPEQIAGLRRLLDDGLVAMRAQELLYPTLGWRFHTAVVATSGNITLTLMAEAFEQIAVRHAAEVTASWAPFCGQLVHRAERAHRMVIDLIESRDGDAAEAFWRRHMQVVRGLLFESGGHDDLVELMD